MVAKQPSAVSPNRGWFDRLAEAFIDFAARGRFFVLTVAVASCWIAWGYMNDFSDRWLAVGGTTTAALAFVLVALLENASQRRDMALQRKLNALADGLADLMKHQDVPGDQDTELRASIGLEHRESTSEPSETSSRRVAR